MYEVIVRTDEPASQMGGPGNEQRLLFEDKPDLNYQDCSLTIRGTGRDEDRKLLVERCRLVFVDVRQVTAGDLEARLRR